MLTLTRWFYIALSTSDDIIAPFSVNGLMPTKTRPSVGDKIKYPHRTGDPKRFRKSAGLYLRPLSVLNSVMTHCRQVSEPSPYSCITSLGVWLRIADFSLSDLIFCSITIPSNVTRGHVDVSDRRLVSEALRGSRQFDSVAARERATRRLYLGWSSTVFPHRCLHLPVRLPPVTDLDG